MVERVEHRRKAKGAVRVSLIALGAALVAGCASAPTVTKRTPTTDPKYGVTASPRVADVGNRQIDRSQQRRGREMVGRPYTIAGKRYVPRVDPGYDRVGTASWYGDDFHGRLTANGEVFDMHDISAAHPTMPLPSYARVTNTNTGTSIVVRVNDRGPYHGGRLIDLSKRAATLLGFKQNGVGRVRVQYLGKADPDGSDEEILAATLRTDGSMAPRPAYGMEPQILLADAAQPPVPRPSIRRTGAADLPVLQASYVPVDTATPPPTIGDPNAAAPLTATLNAGVVPLPPDRPLDLLTIPGADTPVPASRTNERTASTEPRQVVTRTAKLAIEDIVGRPATLGNTPIIESVMAYAPRERPIIGDDPGYFVTTGTFRSEAEAVLMERFFGPASIVEMQPDASGTDVQWVVRAGPYADRELAELVAFQARAAGAAGTRVEE